MHIMQESLKIFKQPKHKAEKFQQNKSVNPDRELVSTTSQHRLKDMNWTGQNQVSS